MPASANPSIPTQSPAASLCDTIHAGGFFAALLVNGRGEEQLGFVPIAPASRSDPAAAPILSDLGEQFREDTRFRTGLTDYLRDANALYVAAPVLAHQPEITVPDAIVAHRLAVDIDKAWFDEDGKRSTGTDAERNARTALIAVLFRQLLEAPCRHPGDVQLKIDYVLNGTAGDRDPLLTDVLGDDGGDLLADDGPLKTFLRSLLIGSKSAFVPQPKTSA